MGGEDGRVDELFHRAVDLQRVGGFAAALGVQRQAERLLRGQIAGRGRDDPRLAERLAALLYGMGASLNAVGRFQDALAVLDESLGLYGEAGAASGLVADVRTRRADSLSRLGRGASAVLELDEVIGVYRGLGAEDPGAPQHLDLARVLARNAEVLAVHGDRDLAVASADQCVRMYLGRAAEINAGSDLVVHAQYLHGAIGLAAELHAAGGRLDMALEADEIALRVSESTGMGEAGAAARMGVHLDEAGRSGEAGRLLDRAAAADSEAVPGARAAFERARPVTFAAALAAAGVHLPELVSDPRAPDAALCVSDRCPPSAAVLRLGALVGAALGLLPGDPAHGGRIGLETHFLYAVASRAREPNLRYRFGDLGPGWARVLEATAEAYRSQGAADMADDLADWNRGVLLRLQPFAPVVIGEMGPVQGTPDSVDAARRAGTLVARALARTAERLTAAGPTLEELAATAREHLAPARPSYLGYRGFPAACDIAVNEVVCSGVPGARTLAPGDVVTLGLAGYLDGMHCAATASHVVAGAGEHREAELLVERAREALRRAVAAVRPGRAISVVGRVIESYARRFGYGVVRDFGGHGIGPALHQEPFVPGWDDPGATTAITEGMIFTVHVMFTMGDPECDTGEGGWNVTTRDRSKAAAFAHTVLVTEDGARILSGGSSEAGGWDGEHRAGGEAAR